MQTTTRLLLPFTEEVDAQALDCALQLVEQRRAILVPLALIKVRPGRNPRLELIQQAQDFLCMIQIKCVRHGVSVQSSQIYVPDVARSIEAFASEMRCESVILFLHNTRKILLGHADIQMLVTHANCNMDIVFLPDKCGRKAFNQPLHIPLFKPGSAETSDMSLLEQERERASLIHKFIRA